MQLSVMKVNRSSSSNLRFLYGSVFFFAVLILTMVLFIYYAMSESEKKSDLKIFAYTISVSGDSDGNGCDVIFDDSLVYSSGRSVPEMPVLVNRRILRDTVVSGGERIIREKILFSPQSLLHVISHGTCDTVSVIAGDNSTVNIFIDDGRARVELLR